MRRLIAAALVLAGCGGGSQPAPLTHAQAWVAPPQPEHGATCRNCHPDIVRDWSRTGMARSLGPISTEEFRPLTQLDPVEDGAGYGYAFASDPKGTPLILETLRGKPSHMRPSALAFAVGSGELDRAYVAAVGPLMAFAPLEVLPSPQGRHAALAPGNAMRAGTRLASPITADCLGCHSDQLPEPSWPEDLGPDPGAWSPKGISCAACHGQVSAHAEVQEAHALSGETTAAPGDPLPDLASLSRELRVSVCAACHLQGDASIRLRPGTPAGPPPPGTDVTAARAVFVAAEASDEIGFVSQVERLALSDCFTQSAELDCTTCHDPHRSLHDPREDQAARLAVRNACAQCHAPADCAEPPEARAQADCVACHMPKTGVFDVADVRIHDHYIRRNPPQDRPGTPATRLRSDESATGDWRLFQWPGQDPLPYAEDAGLWLLATAGRNHATQAARHLDAPLGPLSASLPAVHNTRGMLLAAAQRPAEAEDAYRTALLLDPDHVPAVTNLALLLQDKERLPEGLDLLDRTLARFPKAEGALRNRAILRHAAGDLPGMATDLEAAFWIRPSAALAQNLAQYYAQAGNPAQAKRWRDAARATDPLAK